MLSQVLAELDDTGGLVTWYTRGDELISLSRPNETRFYLYDGHGSTRLLTDEDGAVTDTYTFDAYGNLTARTGATVNDFLYCGEQFDQTTGLYYLRAMYMNPQTGTFISMDVYQGSIFDPVSLHKYLYANANPVMNVDPTGYFTLAEISAADSILNTLRGMATVNMFGILNGVINAFVTMLSGGTSAEMQAAFAKGFVNGFFDGSMMAGGFAAIGVLAEQYVIARLIMAGIYGWYACDAFLGALESFVNGDYDAALFKSFVGTISTVLCVSNVRVAIDMFSAKATMPISTIDKKTTQLDWSIVKNNGESRVQHVNGHMGNNLLKSNHGVFYGDAQKTINNAWMNKDNAIFESSIRTDIYHIPYNNSGYAGGYSGQGQNLNYVTIVVVHGTNKIITGYPSSGW